MITIQPSLAVAVTPPLAEHEVIPEEPLGVERAASLPPYLISPTAVSDENSTLQMITVVMRSTGDKTRDVLRLRRLHGIIISYPGNDRFAFHVFERGRGYLLEFPNFTAGLCPELITRLHSLIGPENVRIEPITIQ
jgi:DNA polymerase-3 subunit alpha